MKKIIYFTRFMPTCDRGGGSRRMIQIREALKELNLEVVSSARKDRLDEEALERIRLNIEKTINQHKMWGSQHRASVCRLGEISREWAASITGQTKPDLVIMDDPIYFTPLMEKLNFYGVPVVGICHNLETLAPQQVKSDPIRLLFNKEIDLLARCDLVVTISREETFLLHNLGINTVFFPYYPVEPILNRLQSVRQERKKPGKTGILLVGSVLNLQTREGMVKAIDYWYSVGLYRDQGKLMAAGYRSEEHLKDHCSRYQEAVKFLGSLPNEMLDRLLCTVRACLCFQDRGAGALTRICEMLIAAVPVLANSHAARSYYNMEGVIEFRALKTLGNAFKKIDRLEGKIPVPQPPDTSLLLSEIKKIMD